MFWYPQPSEPWEPLKSWNTKPAWQKYQLLPYKASLQLTSFSAQISCGMGKMGPLLLRIVCVRLTALEEKQHDANIKTSTEAKYGSLKSRYTQEIVNKIYISYTNRLIFSRHHPQEGCGVCSGFQWHGSIFLSSLCWNANF